jgi:YidC/Oxa1 family membrane protein insertase
MSLEKRLPLALLLSFVLLFGWGLLQGGPPPAGSRSAKDVGNGADAPALVAPVVGDAAPAGGLAQGDGGLPGDLDQQGDGAQQGAAAAPGAAAAQDDVTVAPELSGPASDAAEPWQQWLELGRPGERGHYFALFDSAGASLLELRSGEFWVRRGLTAEERGELRNRTPILVPVRSLEPDRTVRTRGSLTLVPGHSARGLAPNDLDRVHWHHEVLPDGVRFKYPTPGGLTFVKEIRAEPSKHHLRVRLGIENRAATEPAGRSVRFILNAAEAVPPETDDKYYVEPKGVAGHLEKGTEEVARVYSGRKVAKNLYDASRPGDVGDIAFLGGHNKYFAALLRPADLAAGRTIFEASVRPVFDGDWAAAHPAQRAEGYRYVAADAVVELTVPQVGGTAEWDYVLYAGPKSSDHFALGDEAFEQILDDDLGFFDGVAGLILRLLRFLHGIFGNWGVAIIALTILVRTALFPLNRRMQTSMARHGTKMKRIQPKIDAVKEKYKDDPKRLREEQAKIIQQEGAIPPLGGCLPLFIQIPIFFGLFSALRVAFDLRQQPFFGWINDLAQPDRLAPLGLDLWIIDLSYLNILPILMVVLWIGQQKVMPKPTDPQALQMHKMMMWMPIIFGLFLYDYAAGLSLYMITSSLFGIAEFTVIRKIWPLDDKEQPKKQGGFLAKLAQLQEQAQKVQQQKQNQSSKGPGKGGGKGPGKGPGKGR